MCSICRDPQWSCSPSLLSVPHYMEDQWRLYKVSLPATSGSRRLQPCWAGSQLAEISDSISFPREKPQDWCSCNLILRLYRSWIWCVMRCTHSDIYELWTSEEMSYWSLGWRKWRLQDVKMSNCGSKFQKVMTAFNIDSVWIKNQLVKHCEASPEPFGTILFIKT